MTQKCTWSATGHFARNTLLLHRYATGWGTRQCVYVIKSLARFLYMYWLQNYAGHSFLWTPHRWTERLTHCCRMMAGIGISLIQFRSVGFPFHGFVIIFPIPIVLLLPTTMGTNEIIVARGGWGGINGPWTMAIIAPIPAAFVALLWLLYWFSGTRQDCC